MEPITIALLLILIATMGSLFVIPSRARGGSIDFFQPGLVFLAFGLLYYVIPPAHLAYSLRYHSDWIASDANLVNYTLLTIIIGCLTFGLAYRFDLRTRKPVRRSIAPAPATPPLVWPKRMDAVLAVFFAIGLVARISVLNHYGGFSSDLLANLSPSARKAFGVEVDGWLLVLNSFFDWAFLGFLFRVVLTRRLYAVGVVVLVVGAALAFTTGAKRSAVLPFVLFPMVWHHYLVAPIKARWMAFGAVALVGFVALSLFVRVLVPNMVKGTAASNDAVSTISDNPLHFYLNSPELNVFDMTMVMIAERDQVIRDSDGLINAAITYNFETLLFFVPRALWEDKPDYDDVSYVAGALAGAPVGTGYAVAVIGVFYMFGLLPGVFIGMGALGYLTRNTYLWLCNGGAITVTRAFFYPIALVMFFQFLRFGVLGFTMLVFFQSMLPSLVFGFGLYVFRPRLRRTSGAMLKRLV